MAAGKAGPLSGRLIPPSAHEKPGAVPGRKPGLYYPACALIKNPISGKPEIGAQFVSFYFPTTLNDDSGQAILSILPLPIFHA